MNDLYDKTSERLWEKLEYYRNDIDITCVNLKESFPVDQLAHKNPLIWKLIEEVEKEFNYGMSEFQASWAVVQFIEGGLVMMRQYNEKNGTNLSPLK